MHEEAIRKADVLIEALGFIRKFHGKFTVIKLGGSVMEDPETLRALLVDVVFMQTVGMRPVVVHGGGKAITVAMEKAGLDGPVRAGPALHRRAPRSAIVARVLAEEINADIERHINKFGGRASGLHHKTHQCLYGRKLWLENGPAGRDRPGAGRRGDRGRRTPDREPLPGGRRARASLTGRGRGRRRPALERQCRHRRRGRRPGASGREAGLPHRHARHPADRNEPGSLIRGLTPDGVPRPDRPRRDRQGDDPQGRGLPDQPGSRGVKKTHIIDGRLRHSLLLEIFTQSGIGTEIVRE